MKILLIKQSSLGDIIHATLAIEAIKEQYPQAKISFMIDKQFAFILKNHPLIKKFYIFDKKSLKDKFHSRKFFSFFKEIFSLIKNIRQEKFDFAIDLQGIERSVLFLYFAKAKQKFVKNRYPFLKGVKLKKNIHALKEIRALLNLAKIKSPPSILPKLYINAENPQKFLTHLDNNLQDIFHSSDKKVFLLNPFTTWQSKNIPIEKLYTIFSLIKKKLLGAKAIVIGPPQNSSIMEKIHKICAEKDIFNLVGKTKIEDIPLVIQLSSFVISGEGGIIHICNALEKDNCVIFGPTSIERVGPWQENSLIHQHPFPKKYYHKKTCPEIVWSELNCQEISKKCLKLILK